MTREAIFAVLTVGLILLNGVTFVAAYPETLRIDGGCCSNLLLAKDFSAYYTGAWRLLHDPDQLYTRGNVDDGGPSTPPAPESFKYTPSFLLLIVPFLTLSYQDALLAFDSVQFLLLPLIAVLLFLLLRKQSDLFVGVALVLVLLLPLPLPRWSISAAYYWQWAEGQAKVLETFLLLSSFWLGLFGRARTSGAVFSLAAFDPRFAVLGLPLLLLFNKGRVRPCCVSFAASLFLLNLPLLLPQVARGFFTMVFSYGAPTPLYYYSFIPLSAVASLYVAYRADLSQLVRSLRKRASNP